MAKRGQGRGPNPRTSAPARGIGAPNRGGRTAAGAAKPARAAGGGRSK